MIYIELQRGLKMEFHEPHTIFRVNTFASKRYAGIKSEPNDNVEVMMIRRLNIESKRDKTCVLLETVQKHTIEWLNSFRGF